MSVPKYLMDREVRFAVVLTSSQNCVLSLVTGGLEIPSEVGVYLPPNQKNEKLVRIYNLIQKQIYLHPERFMIGSFLQTSAEVFMSLTANKFVKKEAGEKRRKVGHTTRKTAIVLFLKANQINIWKTRFTSTRNHCNRNR